EVEVATGKLFEVKKGAQHVVLDNGFKPLPGRTYAIRFDDADGKRISELPAKIPQPLPEYKPDDRIETQEFARVGAPGYSGVPTGSSGRIVLIPQTISKGALLFLTATIAGGLAAAVCGYLVGLPSLRLKGDYLAIVTLGFGEIVRVLIQAKTTDVIDDLDTIK